MSVLCIFPIPYYYYYYKNFFFFTLHNVECIECNVRNDTSETNLQKAKSLNFRATHTLYFNGCTHKQRNFVIGCFKKKSVLSLSLKNYIPFTTWFSDINIRVFNVAPECTYFVVRSLIYLICKLECGGIFPIIFNFNPFKYFFTFRYQFTFTI